MAASPSASPSSCVDHLAQPGGVALGVGDQHAGAGRRQRPGVGRLVVPWCPGERHQDRRHPGHGQLGHGDRAGPADHQVGGGVEGRHVVFEGHPSVGQGAGGRLGGPVVAVGPVAPAGDVVHAEVGPVGPAHGQGGHRLVDAPGPQRTPEHPDAAPVGVQAEGAAGPGHGRRGPLDVGHLWRTGVPVTVARGSGVPGKATAEAAAKRPSTRWTRPGTASMFTSTSGTRRATAAAAAGKLA